MGRALDRIALEAEADFKGDLEFRLALGIDCAADVLDLEPIQMAQRQAGLFDRIADGLVDALIGDADHIDYLVGLIGHGILSWRWRASPAAIGGRILSCKTSCAVVTL